MASVTVNLTGYSDNTALVQWIDTVSLGSTFSANGVEQSLVSTRLVYNAGNLNGRVGLSLQDVNHVFTSAFVASGRIII